MTPPPIARAQLNLPLLSVPTDRVPDDQHAELVLALVELLIAAHGGLKDGGDHESEAHP